MSSLNLLLTQTYAMDILNEMKSDHEHMSFPVEIIDAQDFLKLDMKLIKFICSRIISDAGFREGHLGVVIGDNVIIQELNNRYLVHDCETDVLSFCLERFKTHLEGDIIISTEEAIRRHTEFGLSAISEAMLYVIHGVLHMVGYDDDTPTNKKLMRQMEAKYLKMIGIDPTEDGPTAR